MNVLWPSNSWFISLKRRVQNSKKIICEKLSSTCTMPLLLSLKSLLWAKKISSRRKICAFCLSLKISSSSEPYECRVLYAYQLICSLWLCSGTVAKWNVVIKDQIILITNWIGISKGIMGNWMYYEWNSQTPDFLF